MHFYQKAFDSLTPVRYSLHMKSKHLTGDLLAALAALSNPHRLRVVAALSAGGATTSANWPVS
jgi:hypothetical protein